jgi:hypothetical protein
MQCIAFLQNSDIRCSRKSKFNKKYCWQHQDLFEEKENQKLEKLLKLYRRNQNPSIPIF